MRISDWSSDVCLPIYPIIQADIGAAQPDEAVVERPEAGFAPLSVHRRAGVGPVPDHRAARCSLSRGNAADEIGGAQPLVDVRLAIFVDQRLDRIGARRPLGEAIGPAMKLGRASGG